MGEDSQQIYLAIDSGATTSRYILYTHNDLPIREGVFPGLNYTEKGVKGIKEFSSALLQLLSPFPGRVCIGVALSGAGREKVKQNAIEDFRNILTGVRENIALFIFHDGESALKAAFGESYGVIVISGTGSIAYGCNIKGLEARCGGWGSITGDEGSAYWIARQAIKAVLKSHDGRGAQTLLTKSVVSACGLQSPEDLVAWIHTPARKKEEIADLAKLVSKLEEAGDRKARQILLGAAMELSLLASTLITKLFPVDPRKVCVSGSVFTGSSLVRNTFKTILSRKFNKISFPEPQMDICLGTSLLMEEKLKKNIVPDLLV